MSRVALPMYVLWDAKKYFKKIICVKFYKDSKIDLLEPEVCQLMFILRL